MPWTETTPQQDEDRRFVRHDGIVLAISGEDDGPYVGRIIAADGSKGYWLEEGPDENKYYDADLKELFEDGDRIADTMNRAAVQMTRGAFRGQTDLETARTVYEIMKRGNAVEIVDYLWANDANGAYDWNLMDRSDALESIRDHFDELLEDYDLTEDQVASAAPIVQPNPPAGTTRNGELKRKLLR